ncbi:MAG TPA: hypothetical protein VF707_11425 [Ardenticatenaceae bacterium]
MKEGDFTAQLPLNLGVTLADERRWSATTVGHAPPRGHPARSQVRFLAEETQRREPTAGA